MARISLIGRAARRIWFAVCPSGCRAHAGGGRSAAGGARVQTSVPIAEAGFRYGGNGGRTPAIRAAGSKDARPSASKRRSTARKGG